MSLYGMMRTGVSGMNAQANRLGTVADNIANASTTGYKRSSTEFSSLILPSTNGSYNSGGVTTNVRYSISEQGTLTYTSSASDLAIDGGGFFIVRGQNGTEALTRAGAFTPDGNGNLVNSAGYTLMGYEYVAGQDPTVVVNGFDGLVEVNLASNGLQATGSTEGSMGANLPSNEAIGYSDSTSLSVYDSQGNAHLLDFTYTKTANNAWTLNVTRRGDPTVLATSNMTFDISGQLTSASTLTTTVVNVNGAQIAPLNIDLTATTQLAYKFSTDGGTINGNAASKATGFQISEDGTVYVEYDNGDLEPRYRVALANVQNPDNLIPIAGNVYKQGVDFGVIITGFAQSGTFGSVVSGALEGSNVDIATELTSMIESQRSYTANSKVFQTGSDLMDVLVNLKR